MYTTIKDLRKKEIEDQWAFGVRSFNETMRLFTLDGFNKIADGETLMCIDGSTAVKGKDAIDMTLERDLMRYGFKK